MKIVVNNIAASSGGAMTVLKDFYSCVCENDKSNEWIFLLGDKYFEETENVKIITLPEIKKNPIKKVLFDFFTGKKFIENLKPDVVFSMQNIITFGIKVPQIVYIHQSIPFQTVKKFSFLKSNERKIAFIQYFIGFLIKLSAKKSDKVIVQTKWMQEAICEQCKISPEKVLQIAPNVTSIEHLREESVFEKMSFFYPTANAIYKNNECIFKACEMLNNEFENYKVTLTVPPELSRGNVECIGRIPYDEVIKYYNRSTLVFPSYIETFGYPLAEARQMGAIILAADTAFARELLDGYENAYFFNPFKPLELAELMEQVIVGDIQRKPCNNQTTTEENSWLKIIREIVEN